MKWREQMINDRVHVEEKNTNLSRVKSWQSIIDHDAINPVIKEIKCISLNNQPPVIALGSRKRISMEEVESRYRTVFFKDLISLEEHRKKKTAKQASQFCLQADSYYSVLTIHINMDKSGLRTEGEFNKTLDKIGHLIDMTSRTQEWTHHIFTKESNVNILFMWNDIQIYNGQIRTIAELIDRLLEKKAGTVDHRIGIGRAHQGIEQIWQCLQDGEKSVDVARTYTNERIVEFEKLGIYIIFSQSHLNEELLSFYNSTLRVLVEYDRKSNSELVKSLKVFFSVNGNLKKMSEILFAHYNTILYRINRIQEITGTNLKSEYDRYDLQTALRIMNILEL